MDMGDQGSDAQAILPTRPIGGIRSDSVRTILALHASRPVKSQEENETDTPL